MNEKNIDALEENDSIPFPAGLFEKAKLVHERILELKQDHDQSVFVGASKDGVFQIALHGDGRPEWVSLNLALTEEEKGLFEAEIMEALEDVYQCRIGQMEEGLDDLQREMGIGPGFKLPF